jgi:tRNA threonylcarbamoyladenosine biosynthesis protein TsaE
VSIVPALASGGRLAVSEPELRDWGVRLGKQIVPPLVITLAGDLGAGKTTLARAICEGYGVTDDVTSHTFAIVHEYTAPRSTVHHIDLYRIEGVRDLQNIGWDDIMAGEGLVIVEWPERALDRLPDHVPIELRHIPRDPARRVLYAGGHLDHRSGGQGA